MKYIGDLSAQDAKILEFAARRAHRVLEFGMGASTQIMAQSIPDGGHLLSLDTDPRWVERTRLNLAELDVPADLFTLAPYDGWQTLCEGVEFDLIFVDGVDNLRSIFARTAWHHLALGGNILFHDTRRIGDLRTCVELAMEHFTEAGDIFINLDSSNISGFSRKPHLPYTNWNIDEKRTPWMTGEVAPPSGWPGLLTS